MSVKKVSCILALAWMAHSRAVRVIYLLVESVGWLIPGWLESSTYRSQCMAHSRAVRVLYLLEPVGWLILELLESSTCWSQ